MSAPLCGRIGCDSTASCVLLIAPQECEAWLVGLDHPNALEGVRLCEVHADRITVPFGWGLHNERPAPKKRRRRKATAKPAEKSAAQNAPHKPTPAKARRSSKPADPEPRTKAPIFQDEAAQSEPAPPVDEPTIQLPAIDANEPAPTASPPPPSDVPVRADHVAEAIADADDPRHLQVVVRGANDADAERGPSDEVQPSLWEDDEEDALEPGDNTPLLKRAFRVVRDD